MEAPDVVLGVITCYFACLRLYFLQRFLPSHATATMCRFVIYKGTSPVQLSHVSGQVQFLSGSAQRACLYPAPYSTVSFHYQPSL